MTHSLESTAFKSAVYAGKVRHRRFLPGKHEFNYPLFMLYLDLDELPTLFSQKWFCSLERFNVVNFKREDYLSPDNPSLKNAVIANVKESLGDTVDIHSVRALMHVRYLNVVFNPVVIYYCFDEADQPVAILAEITNTPWNERHHYVFAVNNDLSNPNIKKKKLGNNKFEYLFDKAFHVSPFNPMNMDYRWIFSLPEKRLNVHMENRLKQLDTAEGREAEKHFDATLLLERKEFNNEFGKILIQYPFITVKVIIGIYWQALKLWLKRMPFYDHPNTKDQGPV